MRESFEGPAQTIVPPADLPAAMFGRTVATFEPFIGSAHSTIVMSEGVVGTAQPILVLHEPADGVREAIVTLAHRIVELLEPIFSTSQTIAGVREAVVGVRQSIMSMRRWIVAGRQSAGAGVGPTVTPSRSIVQPGAAVLPARRVREPMLKSVLYLYTACGGRI